MSTDKKIRVLIADDSMFMRHLLQRILEKEQEIEIVGTAKDGTEAIQLALQLKPDEITMDFNMPVYNGAEATAHILSNTESYKPGVVMFSAYTKKEAKETLESLRSGAVDFIAKPSGEISANLTSIKEELVEKIKTASIANVRSISNTPSNLHKTIQQIKPRSIDLIIIGASTGGPPIIEDILTSLPQNFQTPIIVCQHMPSTFTAAFAERLNRICQVNVIEAQENELIERGKVMVLPGDKISQIKNQRITLEDAPEKGPLITIDTIMKSAAETYFGRTLGIILSGMGKDGLEGIKKIKEQNGSSIAQEPTTTVINSMPCSIINEHIADQILTPSEISQTLLTLGS